MTDKAAIRELREKVEAGGAWSANSDTIRPLWRVISHDTAYAAYRGSLDAALALHEAVLPGWGYCIDAENSDPSVCVYGSDLDQVGIGTSKSPARAWLIAVLKAMEAEEL